MSTRKEAASAARKEAKTLADEPLLLTALDNFINDNCQFESSVVKEAVIGAITEASDINAAAMEPVRHKVFGFDAALKWGFFLSCLAKVKGAEEGWAPCKRFKLDKYFIEVGNVYDLATDANVWAHCEVEDDSDDSDGFTEEDEDDEEE